MAENTNPFSDFLDGGSAWSSLLLQQLPQATYYSSPAGQSFTERRPGTRSPRRQRYFEQSYPDIYNQYMGQLGTQIRETGTANLTFQDYLDTDPWTSRYAQLPQSARGMNTGMYSPRTRFLYY